MTPRGYTAQYYGHLESLDYPEDTSSNTGGDSSAFGREIWG